MSKTKESNSQESWFKIFVRRFSRNKLAVVAAFVILLFILIAIFAPLICPYDYAAQDLKNGFMHPCREHLFGTDRHGRDVFSRVIYGTRYSLTIGIVSVFCAAAIGVVFGAVSGYYGGTVDTLLMRFLDIYQSVPMLLMAMALSASLGPGIRNAMIAIIVTTAPLYARFTRSSFMEARERDYVEAARATNASDLEIMFRHIFPNVLSPLIVQISLNIGYTIIFAATLSFIGLGAQPPTPEWGALISYGRDYMRDHSYLIFCPGVVMLICVLAFNLFGDGCRDALDPRLKD